VGGGGGGMGGGGLGCKEHGMHAPAKVVAKKNKKHTISCLSKYLCVLSDNIPVTE